MTKSINLVFVSEFVPFRRRFRLAFNLLRGSGLDFLLWSHDLHENGRAIDVYVETLGDLPISGACHVIIQEPEGA